MTIVGHFLVQNQNFKMRNLGYLVHCNKLQKDFYDQEPQSHGSDRTVGHSGTKNHLEL